jgi:nucleotide-binding universal stress UspA family protein
MSNATNVLEGRRGVHALGVDAAFGQLIAELAPAAGVRVERAIVPSAPGHAEAEQLLSLVDRAHAELLAVRSHHHDRVERWLLGSVTTDLVREGRHSVLVVPPHQGGGSPADVRAPECHTGDGR